MDPEVVRCGQAKDSDGVIFELAQDRGINPYSAPPFLNAVYN
jgi:hypothetical protein